MFRNGEYPKIKTSVNCLLTDGGLGDLLCSFVAINYILKNCPYINLLIWLPDYMVEFAKNVLPKENNIIRGYTEAKKKYNENLPAISTRWNKVSSPMRTHPVDYAFHVLCDKHVDYPDKNYLKLKLNKIDISKFNLPDKYVTIQAYSREAVKRLSGIVINNIAKYCIIKGYKVVFVGSSYSDSDKQDDIDLSLGFDLTNKTSLTEVGKVIANSKCFIGMDGGLVHVAGFTEVPIVAAYTFANWNHLAPIRNGQIGYNCHIIEPSEELECRYCQTNWILLYGVDYRNCRYDDYKCIKDITVNDFIKQLDKVL